MVITYILKFQMSTPHFCATLLDSRYYRMKNITSKVIFSPPSFLSMLGVVFFPPLGTHPFVPGTVKDPLPHSSTDASHLFFRLNVLIRKSILTFQNSNNPEAHEISKF